MFYSGASLLTTSLLGSGLAEVTTWTASGRWSGGSLNGSIRGRPGRTPLNFLCSIVSLTGGDMKTTLLHIFVSILGALFLPTAAQAADCPAHAQKRSPEQVLEDHVSALLTGDLDLIACDYDDDAVIITPDNVVRGHDQI